MDVQRLSIADWKAAAKSGEAPAAILRKQFIADRIKATDGNDRLYEFTLSTGVVDRDRDTVAPLGWKLDNFLKNPVVLWAHDSAGLPIGRAEWIAPQAGALKARVLFAPPEANPLAEQVRQLIDFGALKAVSVGFIPIKSVYDEQRNGYDFLEQELLEFSVVPIPANPEALISASAAGIDIEPVRRWASGVLAALEPGFWLSEAHAQALIRPEIDVLAVVKGAMAKAGRTLSQANEARIRGARDASDAIRAALDEVLAQVTEPDAGERGSPGSHAAGPPGATPGPATPFLTLKPPSREAVIRRVVAETVTAAARRARGLID